MTATITTPPTWPEDVPVHPAAELFPLMGGSEFAELVEDIRDNGLVAPIVRTPDGHILDGRNRYRACLAADVEPQYGTHAGEPWQFVISTNLHRRHLTDSQRAMVAARIADRAKGRRSENPASAGFSVPTQAETARLLNVSLAHVERARVVHKQATPALKAAVESGAVPVTTAARVSALPADRQDEFVGRVASGERPTEAAPPAPPKTSPTLRGEPPTKAEAKSTAEERAARISELVTDWNPLVPASNKDDAL